MVRPAQLARLALVALAPAAMAGAGCSEVAEVLRARDAQGGAGTSAGAGGTTSAGTNLGGEGPTPTPELGVSLSSGQSHACMARGGIAYCWGDNRDGQLGAGDTAVHTSPVRVESEAEVVQLSVGERHSCWLDAEGRVSCFGSNAQGQLGSGAASSATTPIQVPLPAAAKLVDSGYQHSCAILTTGELYCWGANVETQLGQGDAPDENQSTPLRVTGFADFIDVACGQGHTIALRETGEVYGWGRNTVGQVGLGDGMPNRIREPTLIAIDGAAASIDAGQDSACAVLEDGRLACWGASLDQHLGNGVEGPVLTPTLVSGLPPLSRASNDTFHTCGLDAAGAAYCWGRGIEGQLGLGDERRLQSEPIQVPAPPASWEALAVGRFFTCGVASDERVYCTGRNTERELGTADTERRSVFTEVTLP